MSILASGISFLISCSAGVKINASPIPERAIIRIFINPKIFLAKAKNKHLMLLIGISY
jgi:hypothetical protein